MPKHEHARIAPPTLCGNFGLISTRPVRGTCRSPVHDFSCDAARARLPALRLRLSQGTGITVGGSNPGLCYQTRREVAVNFTTD